MLPCSRNPTVNVNVYFQCWCYYRVVKLSWNNHPLFTVQRASSTTHLPQNTCPAFPCSTNKWEFTLNSHAVAMSGTSGGAREHLWPRATSALYTQKTHQVPPVSLSSTHPFLGAVFVQLMLNTAAHELSKAGRKFLSWADFSFPAVTPVCLTYRQRSHLSPSSSPAHPTAEPEWITGSSWQYPWRINGATLKDAFYKPVWWTSTSI